MFREHNIDGSSLPLLTEDHLTLRLGMKLGPALKLKSILARKLGPSAHAEICAHCSHCKNMATNKQPKSEEANTVKTEEPGEPSQEGQDKARKASGSSQ